MERNEKEWHNKFFSKLAHLGTAVAVAGNDWVTSGIHSISLQNIQKKSANSRILID
jgi:hypothetical protein